MQVYHHDQYARNELYGYGFVHIPTSPGMHDLECVTWKPIGGFRDQVTEWFLGGSAQLRKTDVVYTGADRYNLQTVAMGKVHLKLGVILRNFDKFGVEC